MSLKSNQLRYPFAALKKGLSAYASSMLVILVFIPRLLLFAQDNNENQTSTDPISLTPNWWENFTDDKEVLQKRVDSLLNNIQSVPDDLSEENREEAQNLIDQIQVNFQAWTKIHHQPLPSPQAATTYKDHYSIDTLRVLFRNLKKQAIDLASKENELKGLEQQLSATQQQLDQAQNEYLSAKERSQEKILSGLKILKFRPAVEVLKKKLTLLRKTIEIERDQVKFLQDEINISQDRLEAHRQELLLYARELDSAKQAWDDAKKARQQAEVRFGQEYSEDITEEAETKNNSLTLFLIDASVKELLAQVDFIRREVIYQLLQELIESSEVNIDKLDASIGSWEAQLNAFDLQVDEWTTQTKRILQRGTQVISLKDEMQPAHREELEQGVDTAQKMLLQLQTASGSITETRFLLEVLEKNSLSHRGKSERWLKVVFDFIFESGKSASERLNKTLFYVGTHPVSTMTMLQFLLIMVLTWWFSRLVTGAINTFSRRRKGIRKALIYRLKRLIHYSILFVGAILGLSWIGFDFSNLVLIAGALGVGLGFGLQNIFNNFLSGIIILFQSHLKVGDYIELDTGLRGEIREINVRSTVITTNDGIEVIIPNSEMVSNRIINWTLRDPYRRVHVPFSVAYGSNLENVSTLVIDAANDVSGTLKKIGVREPQVLLVKLGDNGIELELRVWVNEKWTRRHRNTLSQYLFAIEKTLRENGIEIPYPQRDVHLKSGFGDNDSEKYFTESPLKK